MGVELIKEYFPLTVHQEQQFAALDALYRDWNAKINIISRKDIDNLYEHHILHSLAIAKVLHFRPGTRLLDVGTGGGFPGIPLAILFPDCPFTLIDSIGKKVRVANDIAQCLELCNVTCVQERAEEEKGKFDYVVSRAVMPFPDLVRLVQKNIDHTPRNAMPNGLIVLKGGNLDAELKPFKKRIEVTDISTLFKGEWFVTKQVVYLPL